MQQPIPSELFRAYDIRGLALETLSTDNVKLIAQAFGSELHELGKSGIEPNIVVGRDGRLSSPTLMKALIQGLRATGCNVVDLGLVPTPVVYFATDELNIPNAIIITGSHNPPAYNGLKLVIQKQCLHTQRISALRERIISKNFQYPRNRLGTLKQYDILNDYSKAVTEEISLQRPLKIAIDCGNGATSVIAPQLFKTLDCDVTPLFSHVDGQFPNHSPDPTVPENLNSLRQTVLDENLDLGIAFDGDGDRMIAVDNKGHILWPDRMMMLFAQDILQHHPKARVAFDVKCTHLLPKHIEHYGGKALMCASGHSLLKAYMLEEDAIMGGEFSGHLVFRDRWSDFDDGLYAAARLLELISQQPETAHQRFSVIPETCSTAELKINVDNTQHAQALIQSFIQSTEFPQSKVSTIDGFRVDFPQGWGLIRSSNTTPCLTLRFEAESQEMLRQLQNHFQDTLVKIDHSLIIKKSA